MIARRNLPCGSLRNGFAAVAMIAVAATSGVGATPTSARVIRAEVVALDHCYMANRLGTSMPQGMVFALRRDVVSNDPTNEGRLVPGKVTLRADKRPRPIVLRMNVGDTLEVKFWNLLQPLPKVASDPQPAIRTRQAGFHVMGMTLISSIASDGSFVGENATSLIPPDGERTITYRFHAQEEGAFLAYSTAADFGKGTDAGQLTAGLFGSVTVHPWGAEWYRSQVTRADLDLATKGRTTAGQPLIDYGKLYDPGSKYPDGTPIPSNTPVLKMLNSQGEIVHGDLTAIITGKDAGAFPKDTFPEITVVPERYQPYREFAIHYHDATTLMQAFAEFGAANSPLRNVLAAGKDGFAINYGVAGIGAEIWANRIGVGPMHSSVESKFEEFFLSSWVVGDPAMVVDVPANAPAPATAPADPKGPDCLTVPPDLNQKPRPGPKATRAFYPDDPSNVYHSYLHDHVKFRILHAGGNVTHVHHQHAHQWLRTPNSDSSTLLDSQMITPGDAFTLEMIYGSGNRNMTPGDSIFHCHFYPHFAAGMWSLWRVHDVFEAGTELDQGVPKKGARALPDGEILTGTPIPALVPLPTLPMAPIPAQVRLVEAKDPLGNSTGGVRVEVIDPDPRKNPGYPFFVPGVGGRRAPHPPYDFAEDERTHTPLDGGLPRHLVLNGSVVYHKENKWDFSKDNVHTVNGKPEGQLVAVELPETGTDDERRAIDFHKDGVHPSFTPEDVPRDFLTNGSGPFHGAPLANPAVTPDGKTIDAEKVTYKAADVQLDVVFNKKGWHFPQQRITALWGDVGPLMDGTKAPEPLFFRANSEQVIEYWLANLIPGYYDLDNFQVRTPTDIVGQHIHLVKFDVLASDGAANGFNYEDGSFSPDEVRARIAAITNAKGLWEQDGTQKPLSPRPIPFFGPGPDGDWVGAQATVQRWYADPLFIGKKGHGTPVDRTLRTVFTHDHFGPSTHQQAGLYAGLLVEPKGSEWLDTAKANERLGGRTAPAIPANGPATKDGGPTSWQAIIAYTDGATGKTASYREFALEFQDFQLAYARGSRQEPVAYKEYPTPDPTTAWGWFETAASQLAIRPPGGGPTLISTGPEPGTRSVNYRNEPLAFRLAEPTPPDPNQTDLSQVYRSIARADADLNQQPDGPLDKSKPKGFHFPGGFPGADDHDPYTPLMRAYQGDDVQIRVLVGAHMVGHSFGLHGLRWLTEPSDPESGYRGTQAMGISEHFEMVFTLPTTAPASTIGHPFADYLYMPSSGTDGQQMGLWGLLRAYQGEPNKPLVALATNPGRGVLPASKDPVQEFLADFPKHRVKTFHVTATTAAQALPDGQLVYYQRNNATIADKDALIYVLSDALGPDGKLKAGDPNQGIEPLILRVNAGDVVEVVLTNQFNPAVNPVFQKGNPAGPAFPGLKFVTSRNVGLHPQLVSLDVTNSDGFNVGQNPTQTATPGAKATYRWYAGLLEPGEKGKLVGIPVEFGAANLLPSDPLQQHPHGLFAALIVEPEGTTWNDARASAIIYRSGRPSFKEFVVMMQGDATPGNPAINYKTEPMDRRFFNNEPTPGTFDWNTVDISDAVADERVSGVGPQTPLFEATAGTPVRFRMLHPGGSGAVPNFTIHGHVWQRRPYIKGSTEIGHSKTSEWTGSLGPFAANDQADIVLAHAGGRDQVPGDYLYRDFLSTDFQGGSWGVFQVDPPGKDTVVVRHVHFDGKTLTLTGQASRDYGTGRFADRITVSAPGLKSEEANISKEHGTFSISLETRKMPERLVVRSSGGDFSILQGRSHEVVQQVANAFQVLRALDTRLEDGRRYIPQMNRLLTQPTDEP